MKSEQLTFAAEVITLPRPGLATFEPRGLTFAASATDADILAIGSRLMACRGYLTWALGSLFAEMMRRRPSGADTTHADHDASWVGEFCDAHQIDPKLRRELTGVYLFYKSAPADAPALSFDHYREAYWGVISKPNGGGIREAMKYLTRAASENLSVSALRALIRRDSATAPSHKPDQLNLADYAPVLDIMRYAARELPRVSTYSPDRARAILADLGEAPAYIDALRARAAAVSASSTSMPASARDNHATRTLS